MANCDYTRTLMDSLNRHESVLKALDHLASVTPDEDDHYQIINLISSSLNETFSDLQKVSIKAATDK